MREKLAVLKVYGLGALLFGLTAFDVIPPLMLIVPAVWCVIVILRVWDIIPSSKGRKQAVEARILGRNT